MWIAVLAIILLLVNTTEQLEVISVDFAARKNQAGEVQAHSGKRLRSVFIRPGLLGVLFFFS